MGQPDPRLRDYHCKAGFWTGIGYVPFWQGDLAIWFLTYGTEPTPRQVRIVQAVLDYPHDLREMFEHKVFDYYQNHIYGAIDFGSPEDDQECAPQLAESGQIWRLISGPELWIKQVYLDEHVDAVEFTMAFGCTWDEEHGLGVRFRDWQIVRFGGAAS